MKAVVKVDIVDGKCVVIYSDGSEQELYDYPSDEGGSGEGITIKQLAENSQPSGAITVPSDVTTLADYAFAGKPITNIVASGVTDIKPYALYKTSITSLTDTNFPSLPNNYSIYLRMPNLVTFASNKQLKLNNGNSAFKDNTSLQSVRIPYATTDATGGGCFQNDGNLELVDLGNASIGNNCFYQCNKLRTIILRKSTVASLANNALTSAAYFKNGGAGGYVYVPSTLIESYKTANVWSTFYGYGTITFRAIEGSEYEL